MDLSETIFEEVKKELTSAWDLCASSATDGEDFMKKLVGVVQTQGFKMERSRRLDQGDLAVQCAALCGRLRMNPVQGSATIADRTMAVIESQGVPIKLLKKVISAGPYLNILLKRDEIFKRVVTTVLSQGKRYGYTEAWKGKRVIVEHTSSNPNAPLHIGNLRNVMVGAHTAKLLTAVGADVRQMFYVNDLGAQIGLTAFGYNRVYPLIEPTMKIDHWIGSMYAVMNTLVELQRVEVDIGALYDACCASDAAADAFLDAAVSKQAGDKAKAVREYVDIFRELRTRAGYEVLFGTLVGEMRGVDDIKSRAGELNLAYERQEPWAVKIFRKMVVDCLTGVQETLETYNVRHDRFDFESELGWEGSNDVFLEIMRSSPYFVPQTQCNEQGVPQGAYLDMTQFIADQKLPTGKKGYMKKYPNLYVLRPDGSTLYTFRDIVYSFKKAHDSDLVLNVIASEQDLAQQKVSLAMYMMNPTLIGRQCHLSYDIVKLSTGKMSGRRGRYLLADDLYTQLKEEVRSKMRAKYMQRGEQVGDAMFDAVTHEVSTAAMKYALLSMSCQTQINFDIAKVTDFEDASAPFILYNSTRLTSLLSKFDGLVNAKHVAPLPSLDAIDWTLLDNQLEWEMLIEFVWSFGQMIKQAACPDPMPAPPQLPEFATHRICEFLNMMVRALSSYYGPKGVRILPRTIDGVLEPVATQAQAAMHARVYLCRAFSQVITNGLDLVMIQPLERM